MFSGEEGFGARKRPEGGPKMEFFSSGQAARELGISRWRLTYLIESGQVPEAARRFAGRRMFTREEVQHIAARLEEIREEKENR